LITVREHASYGRERWCSVTKSSRSRRRSWAAKAAVVAAARVVAAEEKAQPEVAVLLVDGEAAGSRAERTRAGTGPARRATRPVAAAATRRPRREAGSPKSSTAPGATRSTPRPALRHHSMMSWYTSVSDETRAIAFCRRCTTWEPLADDDPTLFAAWVGQHACFNTARTPSADDELDGWYVTTTPNGASASTG